MTKRNKKRREVRASRHKNGKCIPFLGGRLLYSFGGWRCVQAMTKCHICGRAMPDANRARSDYEPDVLPICARASCRHEQEIHAERMADVHHTYWPVLDRMEQKA